MTSPQSFNDFKGTPKSPERNTASRKYLRAHPGLRDRVARRLKVDVTLVSKVLQGSGVSARVEAAILSEEIRMAAKKAA